MPTVAERMAGCLLGGAVGDALGAPVEFSSLEEIWDRFGHDGVLTMAAAYGRVGAVTDDTQMTLFTLEGLIRANVRGRTKGICHRPAVVHHAYLRWLSTQGAGDTMVDGWLVAVPELHHRRAPGTTCLSALGATSAGGAGLGTVETPINDSKRCGGVMRAAPAGFVPGSPEESFGLGCQLAALTHGHPSGYLSAGVLAATVRGILDGASLRAAVDDAAAILSKWRGHGETAEAIGQAIDMSRHGLPAPEELERLGRGWVGEEALAIGLCCALGAADFEAAVVAAVTHSGDSDSTGSIAGNILGAIHGAGCIPQRWPDALELRDVIEALAADAAVEFGSDPPSDGYGGATSQWFERYPGW
jgi:ADP-ribosylglycohydrolase